MEYTYIAYNTQAKFNRGGFSNSWIVEAYASRQQATDAVQKLDGFLPRIIGKKEVGKYLGTPEPFSGKSFVIHTETDGEDGLIGCVYIDHANNGERVNK